MKLSEPSSAYSLYDLILRTAKAAGIAYYGSSGTGKAVIPVDEHDFERCLDVVNDGIKTFIAHPPQGGWRWMEHIAEVTFGTVETTGTVDAGDATSLTDLTLAGTYDTDDEINGYYIYDLTKEIYGVVTGYTAATGKVTCAAGWLDYSDVASSLTPAENDSFSITDVKTVHGDLARYWLPDDFQGEVIGKITYAKDSNVGHIIGWVDESEIRQSREVSVSDSYPMRAAIRPSPVRRRWEIIFDPAPNTAKTVVFPYRLGFNRLKAVIGISTASGDTSVTIGGLANLYPVNYFVGWYAYVVAGTGIGSYAKVTASSVAGALTVADWLSLDGTAAGTNPGATDAYIYVTDGKEHPAGMQFDDAVLSACKAVAELEFEDLNMGYGQKFFQIDLPDAHKQDLRSGPKTLGPMLPGSGRRGHTRVWNTVVSDS